MSHQVPEAIKEKVEALAKQLALAAMEEAKDHALALDGLLTAYVVIAENHPCCTQHSANALMFCGMTLAQKAAHARPQPGQQVH